MVCSLVSVRGFFLSSKLNVVDPTEPFRLDSDTDASRTGFENLLDINGSALSLEGNLLPEPKKK
jgi:hypothetical protein